MSKDNTLTFNFKINGQSGKTLELTINALRNFIEAADDATQRLGTKDTQPYYGLVWDSAKALSEIIIDSCTPGTKYLELGCGLAMPSFVAAKLGAEVDCIDFHPDAEAFFYKNKSANGLQDCPWPAFHKLEWKDASALAAGCDVIIGSDLIYSLDKAIGLADFLHAALSSKKNLVAVIADQGRPNLKDFLERCQTHGLAVNASEHQATDVTRKKITIKVLSISMPMP